MSNVKPRPSARCQIFSLEDQADDAGRLKKVLRVPGQHNVKNALAALTAARSLGIDDKDSFKALGEYRGSWRRFEEKKLLIGRRSLAVINDYAHHPTEVKATLSAAREKYPRERICCVFQPHQYQRTFYLFNGFVAVFKEALNRGLIDSLILTDIYDVAGRENEKIKEKVNSQNLVKAIGGGKAIYLPQAKIKDHLQKTLRGGEVLIIMGAGDIYNLDCSLAGSLDTSY